MGSNVDIAQQRAKVLNYLWPQGKAFHKQALDFANFYQSKIIVIKYGGFAPVSYTHLTLPTKA